MIYSHLLVINTHICSGTFGRHTRRSGTRNTRLLRYRRSRRARKRQLALFPPPAGPLGFPLWRRWPPTHRRRCWSGCLGGSSSRRRHDRGRDDLSVDLLSLAQSDGLLVRIAGRVDPTHFRSCNCRSGDLGRGRLGRQHDRVLVAFRQVGDGRGLSVTGHLLPHLDHEPLGGRFGLLLVPLGCIGVGVGVVLLCRRGAFVQPAGAGGAQQLLAVRRQQLGLLGHPKRKLNGPAVVLLGGLRCLGRRNADPFLAPLSHGEAFEVVVFGITASGAAPGRGGRSVVLLFANECNVSDDDIR